MITEKGFIIPTVEEIYNRKLSEFRTVKPDIRETDSNLIIPLLKFDAVEEYDSYLEALAVYNNLNVYTAVGSHLNNITSHLNMTWLNAKKSTGKVKIIGQNGTMIPQAYGIETLSGVKFVTLNVNAVEITNGEVELDIVALESGVNSNVGAGEITKQTEIISGISTIINSLSTYGGVDKETDTELRERYFKRIDRKSSFTTEGIKNYILEHSLVKKCQVIENDTDLNDAEGRLPHSYECICLGDTNENIFKVLYDYKLAGIRTVGDIKKTIGDITIGFSRPIEVKLDFEVSITIVKDIWKEEFKETIEDILNKYIEKLEPQATLYSYKILGEIYKNTGGIKNINIKVKKNGSSQKYSDYTLNRKEIAVLHDVKIVVGE